MKKGRSREYKCSICGKYISYDEIEKDYIEQVFIPDTEFTVESMTMTHKECIKRCKSYREGYPNSSTANYPKNENRTKGNV